MHIAIIGSRDFPRPELIHRYIRQLPPDTVILSGGARGVDTWAENAAKTRGLRTRIFHPNWGYYGKQAGLIRNREIVEAADKLVAFWDGTSTGTAHSIGLAEKKGIPVEIIRPE